MDIQTAFNIAYYYCIIYDPLLKMHERDNILILNLCKNNKNPPVDREDFKVDYRIRV